MVGTKTTSWYSSPFLLDYLYGMCLGGGFTLIEDTTLFLLLAAGKAQHMDGAGQMGCFDYLIEKVGADQ